MERRTGLVYDSRLAEHCNTWNDDFTEKPERILVPFNLCKEYGLVGRCRLMQCREATQTEMTLMHSEQQIETLKQMHSKTPEQLMEFSKKYDFIYFHPAIFTSASLALGGTLDLVRAVLRREINNGMAIIRPPGHHAMHGEYCGYCYINNVATAAKIAIEEFNLQRILIIDWDVHHGQGTQYMFYDDPRVLYFSIHTYDHGREWPNLRESDYDFIGTGAGKGFNVNVPLNQKGCGNTEYNAIFQQVLYPIAYEFCPELLLVSAGYDSVIGCPEGEMSVTPAMYAQFVNELSALAEGKLCLIQEGGYCIESLAYSIAMSLRTLLGDPCPIIEPLATPFVSVVESVLNVIKVLRPYWKCLRYQDALEYRAVQEFPSLDKLPPEEGLEFVKPSSYDLFEDCYDPEYAKVRQVLLEHIDDLRRHTDLTSADRRLGVVGCSDDGQITSFVEKLKSLEIHTPSDSTSTLPQGQDIKSTNVVVNTDSTLVDVVDGIVNRKYQAVIVKLEQSNNDEPNSNPNTQKTESSMNVDTIVNSVRHCQSKHGIKRVLIVNLVDTNDLGKPKHSLEDGNVLCISFYRTDRLAKYDELKNPPGGVSNVSEIGTTINSKFNITVGWTESTGDADYIAAFQQIVLPTAYQFGPQLIFLRTSSNQNERAGSSADLSPQGLANVVQHLKGLANGNMILLLDGEYDSEHLGMTVNACATVLPGGACPCLPSMVPSKSGVRDILAILDAQTNHWSCLQYRVGLPSEEQLNLLLELS